VIVDALNRIWTDLLAFSASFITPEWGSLVGMLPIFLVIGVVGPIVTILVLAWAHYGFYRPRARASFAAIRRAAPLDADGRPVVPAGEPYSPSEGVIYEPGTVRSPTGEDLVLGCPKCGLVRLATVPTCGNCGLSFSLRPVTRSLRPSGPPPGGAAAA
jgi:hypothetical protein